MELIKSVVSEACREQREICAREAKLDNEEFVAQIDEDSIKNAPEPKLL
jgi:hypothetical protein